MKNTHVTLVYFKPSGKYYSEGEMMIAYEDDKPVPFYRCIEIVKETLKRGERPGLVDCPWEHNEFHVLLTIYTEYGPLPALIIAKGDM